MPEADMVLISIVGTAGLAPALAAIRAGKDIAVASKEILVMAGEEVTREAAKHKVAILPVDSEHNAIFQCLVGEPTRHIRRLILTASGGPFRKTPAADLAQGHARAGAQASDLEHGPQDHHRFGHALQQGPGDDRGALAFRRADGAGRCRRASAKHRPFAGRVRRRLAARAAQPFRHVLPDPVRGDLSRPPAEPAQAARPRRRWAQLTFEAPDPERFPALRLAREAGTKGGTLPAVLNAANEIAVPAFLDGKILFPAIWHTVEAVMKRHQNVEHPQPRRKSSRPTPGPAPPRRKKWPRTPSSARRFSEARIVRRIFARE